MSTSVGVSSSQKELGPRWYVVHTRPHREIGVRHQLSFQRFRSFLPLHTKTVRHARRFRTTQAPFFPRYLFVQIDVERERWRSVLGTFGVSALVMEGDRPKPVPMGLVEGLIGMADKEGVLTFSSILKAGQRVRILSGPLAGRIGELQHVSDNDRVRILLDAVGCRIAASLPGLGVAPVD